MKHVVFYAWLILLAAAGCQKDDDLAVEPVDVEVQVTFSDDYGAQAAEHVDVTLTNVTTQQEFGLTTGPDGTATAAGLPSGTYDVSAVTTFSREAFFEFAGFYPEGEEITFNAARSGLQISVESAQIDLVLQAGRTGNLVIKQVYFAGSHIRNGAGIRDHFIELYNNSDETIYLDSLYIMGAYGANTWRDGVDYVRADGQFDWSKALNMPGDTDANNDYFYTRWLYQVPGSGEDYPLEPGEGVVIAQNALNHRAPYTDAEGETIGVQDPSLTIDLSEADFEVYVGNVPEINPLPSDLDNPDVPNLVPHMIFGRDFIFDTPGRDAYVIFRADTRPDAWDRYASPEVREITDGTPMRYQVPKGWVIDAVEIHPSPTNPIPKKLTTDVDAGYTYVPGGSFSSQSVIRKTARTFGGRRVLQDTNHSGEDFTYLDTAEPGGFAE